MNRQTLLILLFSAVLLMMALPVLAQDATPTLEVLATAEPEPVSEPAGIATYFQISSGFLAALGAVSVFGIGAVAVVAIQMRKDPATIAAIEKLGDSAPPQLADTLIQASNAMIAIAELLKEALDKVPAANKVSRAAIGNIADLEQRE